MPKIREYGPPNLQHQGSQSQSYATLENAGGSFGRAISNFGQQIEDIGTEYFRDQEREEASNINASFAELSAQTTEEIEEQTRDGTINVDKYSEVLQKRIDGLNENINTRGGRRVFERNAISVKAQALRRASRGQAAVKGANAVNSLSSQITSNAGSLHTNPSEFVEVYNRMMMSIEDQISPDGFTKVEAEKLKPIAGKKLAEGAMRGWIRTNPDIAEEKLNSGKFDQIIDSDLKHQLEREIKEQRNGNRMEVERKEFAFKKAQQATQDSWLETNLVEIEKGTISAQKILDAPIKPSFKRSLLNAAAANARDGGGITDPAVYTRLHDRILADPGDPQKIVDGSQFIDLVGKGITYRDYRKLQSDIGSTEEGKRLRADKQAALKVARSAILTKSMTNFGSNMYSPESQVMVQNWIDENRELEKQMVKEGKNPSSLYDPKSSDYVGSPERLKKFQIPFGSSEYFNNRAKETLSKQPYFQPKDDPNARKPGESAADYLKRTGGG